MEANQVKQEIQDFINHADERFLRLVYSMIESEKAENSFFSSSVDTMITRADQSLKSVENGNTRNILEFKKDVESWKKNRAIQ